MQLLTEFSLQHVNSFPNPFPISTMSQVYKNAMNTSENQDALMYLLLAKTRYGHIKPDSMRCGLLLPRYCTYNTLSPSELWNLDPRPTTKILLYTII